VKISRISNIGSSKRGAEVERGGDIGSSEVERGDEVEVEGGADDIGSSDVELGVVLGIELATSVDANSDVAIDRADEVAIFFAGQRYLWQGMRGEFPILRQDLMSS
jgi:hypothetical protein